MTKEIGIKQINILFNSERSENDFLKWVNNNEADNSSEMTKLRKILENNRRLNSGEVIEFDIST